MYVFVHTFVGIYVTTKYVLALFMCTYYIRMYVRVHNMYIFIVCIHVCALFILYTCTNTLISYLITYSLQVSDEEVYCRKDWHQTPRSTIVAIYAKNCVPEECTVEANETVVSQFCLQSV